MTPERVLEVEVKLLAYVEELNGEAREHYVRGFNQCFHNLKGRERGKLTVRHWEIPRRSWERMTQPQSIAKLLLEHGFIDVFRPRPGKKQQNRVTVDLGPLTKMPLLRVWVSLNYAPRP